MSQNTQLTSAMNYPIQNIIFSKPIVTSLGDGATALNVRRIMIGTRNPDGTTGDLLFSTTELFSPGVKENRDMMTKKLNGHSVGLVLWNKDGPTDMEKGLTDTLVKVFDQCKQHLISIRKEIKQPDLELSDLKKFSPLYWKKNDDGDVVEGTGPSLYAKLIVSKKQNKILSQFYDYDGNVIDPLSLIDKFCFGEFVIKIESIFIGSKTTLQVKCYEAKMRTLETGLRRLLPTPKPANKTLVSSDKIFDDDNEEPEETYKPMLQTSTATMPIEEDEDEDIPVAVQQPKKVVKIVKKTVK